MFNLFFICSMSLMEQDGIVVGVDHLYEGIIDVAFEGKMNYVDMVF